MAIKQIKLPNGTVHDIATTISNVEGLETALNEKAPKASAALTGTPTAPTAAAGTKTTQIATTAFVNTEINNKIAAADGSTQMITELWVRVDRFYNANQVQVYDDSMSAVKVIEI